VKLRANMRGFADGDHGAQAQILVGFFALRCRRPPSSTVSRKATQLKPTPAYAFDQRIAL
jgi:hypothetical protein